MTGIHLGGCGVGKLSMLKPQVSSLKGTVAYAPDDKKEYDRHRSQRHWRKWYNTTRWRKLRWSILVRDLFTCQRCGKVEGNTSQLVADHIVKHGGIEAKFFDASGCQTLCKPCHDSAKQREERKAGW